MLRRIILIALIMSLLLLTWASRGPMKFAKAFLLDLVIFFLSGQQKDKTLGHDSGYLAQQNQ